MPFHCCLVLSRQLQGCLSTVRYYSCSVFSLLAANNSGIYSSLLAYPFTYQQSLKTVGASSPRFRSLALFLFASRVSLARERSYSWAETGLASRISSICIYQACRIFLHPFIVVRGLLERVLSAPSASCLSSLLHHHRFNLLAAASYNRDWTLRAIRQSAGTN